MRRTNILPVSLALLLLLLTCACWLRDGSDLLNPAGFDEVVGSGQLATQNRAVASLFRVDLSIGSSYIARGPREKLRIVAEDNLRVGPAGSSRWAPEPDTTPVRVGCG